MRLTPVIALLTDFGLSDAYVGVMRGVIAQINPNILVIDISHQIPPQNIMAGRYCLMSAYPYFPTGTVYIGVVDPGVGSQRRAIALQLDGGYLVGPDNGIFSGLFHQHRVKSAVELTNNRYWHTTSPSTTFHGRDIFAAVGAHLALGVPLLELGNPIDPKTLVNLPLSSCHQTENRIAGAIQYIDTFGNLVSNIPAKLVTEGSWWVEIKGKKIPSQHSYSDATMGEALGTIGSQGWVEIAINCGNAALELKMGWGDRLQVILEDE